MNSEKEVELICLTQGMLTLIEYEIRFDELSRFAPHLVDTEKSKDIYFELGLRPNHYNAIAVLKLNTYTEVFQRIQIITKDEMVSESKAVERGISSDKKYWNHDKRKGEGSMFGEKKFRKGE